MMNYINKVLIALAVFAYSLGIEAQDKIVNPDISYAVFCLKKILGGINVSGVENYEDYMLTGISGLSVGQEISVPGSEITEAVKRYWKHGLFSDVKVAAD